jgi:serine/threonine-protein kinase
MTQAGAVLGTPGYMAPEQVRAANDVSTPADVYALGAILFEILAGEPLHTRGAAAMLSTTSGQTNRSVAQRQPDRAPPPELDALCTAATVLDPGARPSAKEISAQIERYLDGDRDHARRRELAGAWLGKARAALAEDAVRNRAAAMRDAGRALALDPDSQAAAELVTRLMLEPSAQLPAALQAELARSEGATQQRQARVAMLSFVAVGVVMVLGALTGVRSVENLVIVSGFTALLATAAFSLSRKHASRTEMMMILFGNATLAMLMSRMFGSLIATPAVTCVMALSLTSYPQLIDRARLVITILLASWVLPVVLERAGVIQSTWSVDGDRVVSMSAIFALGGSATSALLIATNLCTILVIGLFANALARSRRDAQRQVEIQAWHLRQLLPVPA